MRTLRRLGDPYSDEEIAAAPHAVRGKTELDALVAYLQGLGVRNTGTAPARRRHRHESSVGSRDRSDHRVADADLHRHLDLGVAAVSQEDLRSPGAHSAARSTRPAQWEDGARTNSHESLLVRLGALSCWYSTWRSCSFCSCGVRRVKIQAEPDGTSGHVWAHGVLREGVRDLPLWWVLISAAALLFGLIYFVRYPGFGNFKGTLGWTSAEELQRDTRSQQCEARGATATVAFLEFRTVGCGSGCCCDRPSSVPR